MAEDAFQYWRTGRRSTRPRRSRRIAAIGASRPLHSEITEARRRHSRGSHRVFG
jgi:hypothetical protein